MSTLVRCIQGQDDRLIDLAHLDPQDFALIRSLRGEIRRHDRILLCQQAPVDDEGAEMFVRLVGNRFWAVHFRGSICTSDHEIAEESVEHRRQKDYWQRAAEDAGYPVAQELHTGRGTILDVAIDGPYRTGIEVQLGHRAKAGQVPDHQVIRRGLAAGVVPRLRPHPALVHRGTGARLQQAGLDVPPPGESGRSAGPALDDSDLLHPQHLGLLPSRRPPPQQTHPPAAGVRSNAPQP